MGDTVRRLFNRGWIVLLIVGLFFATHHQALSQQPHYVQVQFNRYLSPFDRQGIEKQSIDFLHYIPHKTYIIHTDHVGIQWLQSSDWVDSIAPVSSQLKLDAHLVSSIQSPAFKSFAPQKDVKKSIRIIFQPGTGFIEARKILYQFDADVPPSQTGYDSAFTLNDVKVPVHALMDLANEDTVFLMTELEPPAEPTNANAQQTANMDDIQRGGITGYDLDGSGVSIGVWDVGGVLLNHPQFTGRVSQEDSAQPDHFHPSHVAGTIGANGAGTPQTEGMAPHVTLLCWNTSLDDAEIEANAHRIVASNHSYRAGLEYTYDDSVNRWKKRSVVPSQNGINAIYGKYNFKSWSFDRIASLTNLNIVVSAGNNRVDFTQPPRNIITGVQPSQSSGDFALGYDTINSIGAGKNVITVGAISDLPTGATRILDTAMTDFSSWGPTDDGRIKPDISANGDRLLSLNNSMNVPTKLQSGTSMSAPVVTGTIANLTQLFRRRYGGFDPGNSSMKAILIHTARDAGTFGPDYRFGWGVLDARKAADFIYKQGTEGNHLIVDSIVNGSKTYTANTVGSASIVATLVWTDPPAVPDIGLIVDATSKLINDLDLKITGPGGEYLPWTLDSNNPSMPAIRDFENHIDNVEQVAIDVPRNGVYTIEVSGQVNLGFAQSYSLCVSGLEMNEAQSGSASTPRVYILNPHAGKSARLITPIQVHTESSSLLTRLSIRLNDELIHEVNIEPASNSIIHPASVYVYDASVALNTFMLDNGLYTVESFATNDQNEVGGNGALFNIQNVGVAFNLTPNGERRTAELLNTPNKILAGLFIEEDGYYAIETHAVTDQISADTIITLLGPDSQNTVISSDDDSGVDLFSKTVPFLQGGNFYFVSITGFQGSTGWFGIDVVTTDAPPEPTDEQPPSPVDVIPLQVNQPEKFFINDFGDEQFFTFTTTMLSNYRIRALPEEFNRLGSFKLELYRPDDLLNPIEEGTFVNEISRNIEAGQTLMLKVTAPKTKGTYLLEVAGLSDADPLPVNRARTPVTHEFKTMEPEDRWFTLQVPSTTTYMIDIENIGNDLSVPLNIFMYGPNDPDKKIGQLLLHDKPKAIFIKHLNRENTYYLQLLSESGQGEYNIRFDNPNLRVLFSGNNPLSNMTPQDFAVIQPLSGSRNYEAMIQHPDLESAYIKIEDGRAVDEQPQAVLDWQVHP